MTTMGDLQGDHYDADVDYAHGSPHLTDLRLRQRLIDVVSDAIRGVSARGLPLKVLEVGAGHGGYTEPMLALGCAVTAVDMSPDAARILADKFRTNSDLTVVHDPDGSMATVGNNYTLLACVSVLHHIPDYLTFVSDALSRLLPGGAFVCLQDPLWYERVPRLQRISTRAAYFAWRVRQGDLARGLGTVQRRLRGVYDETKPGDMVEYHVVRSGVDEQALTEMLRSRFDHVTLIPYWSHQSSVAGRAGRRLGWVNTFGIHARGFRG